MSEAMKREDSGNYLIKGKAYVGFKIIMSAFSALQFVAPSLNKFLEEELRMGFTVVFDVVLLPWIMFIIIAGVQLKKINLPKWSPPLPVLLLFVSYLISCLFGFFRTDVDSLISSLEVVLFYGLCNGCLIGLVSMVAYDVGHGFVKKNWNAIKEWFSNLWNKIKGGKKK